MSRLAAASKPLAKAVRQAGETVGDVLKGWHYSNQDAPMRSLDGSQYGTGAAGAERARVEQMPEDLRNRVYFYPEGGRPQPGFETPRPESMVSGRPYRVKVSGVYDIRENPLGLTPDTLEAGLRQAGYKGYHDPQTGMAVTLQDSVEAMPIGRTRGEAEQALRTQQALPEDPWRVTAEAIPSTETDFGQWIAGQPLEIQNRYTDEIDELLSRYGFKEGFNKPGYGSYEGSVSPNRVIDVAEESAARELATARGYITSQDAVPFYRISDSGGEFAMQFELSDGITPATLEEIHKFTGLDFTRSDLDTLDFINFLDDNGVPFSGLDDNQFAQVLDNFFGNRSDVTLRRTGQSQGNYNFTDATWNGSQPEPPQLRERFGELRDRVLAYNETFHRQHGAADPRALAVLAGLASLGFVNESEAGVSSAAVKAIRKASDEALSVAAKQVDEMDRKVFGDRYPEAGEWSWKTDNGKKYRGKDKTAEEVQLEKWRKEAEADIKAGNYEPMFPVDERYYVDPSNYDMGGPRTTEASIPKTQAKYDELYARYGDDNIKQTILDAYQRGFSDLSRDWYAMGQLEQAFIAELGEDAGRAAFKERFADSMAATTGLSDPGSNLRQAAFANWRKTNNVPTPEASFDVPYPAGAKAAQDNQVHFDNWIRDGQGISPEGQPKRHNFSANFLGDLEAMTLDEQMSTGLIGKGAPPKGHYGVLERALADVARDMGINPAQLQDVAWAGFKDMKMAKKGQSYAGKPMIEWVNEAIARTAKITDTPQAEVLKKFIHGKGPLYGLGAVVAGGAMTESQEAEAGVPKATVEAYKLFRQKDGKLYPLFADNKNEAPIGEWLEATAGGPDDLPVFHKYQKGSASPSAMIAAGASAFAASQAQKKDMWDERRQKVLEMASFAARNVLEAIDLPLKGYQGIAGVAGSLMAGNSMDQAMQEGAYRASRPVEENAYDYGGAVTDATGSPAAGTAAYLAGMMGGPI